MRLTTFHESIGLTAERFDDCVKASQSFLDTATSDALFRLGLSPHAPYTVHPELCRKLVGLAALRNTPVAMHIAESAEEIELLRDGRGRLVEMLEELGAWRPGIIPSGSRPLDYLRILAEAPRALVIHGNYLDSKELAFLAESRDRMALVYCPRTHDYFRHAPYPALESLLQLGMLVCVATDSRASNPDLSLLNELRFVADRNPALSGEEVLQLGTWNPARALGREQECGRVAVEMPADFCVLQASALNPTDPYELIWGANSAVVATFVAGKVIHALPGFADLAT